MTINRSWPKGINRNRYEKPVRTPSHRAEVRKPDCVEIKQRMKTIGAEGCVNWADKVEPSGYQEAAVAAVGAGTGGTNNIGGRCTDCNKKTTTARTLPTKCGELMKPVSGLVPPVVTEIALTDGTGVMHYQRNVRESARMTELLMPSNYLEIPELRLPRVFLHLAEEARNVQIENDLSCCSEEVQLQGTGLPSPVLVTVMMNGQPIPNKRILRTTGASTEMMTNKETNVGRCKPIDRADQVVLPDTTEQPVLLGLNTDERGNASADTGGPDVNSDKQSEPVDRLGPQNTTEQPALLGPKTNEKENAPVGPVGLDVNSTGQSDPVNRSGPVGPQVTIEQSVLLGMKTVETENTPVDPGDLDMNSAGRGELVCRPGIEGLQNRTERTVSSEVGADKVGHVPTSPVDPEVLWHRNQSIADGPVGQDGTRRPVGTECMHAEHDADRPTAGGPVAQLFNSDPLCPSGMPFLDELYQPLAVGPVGPPFITGPLGKHVSEPDCRRTNWIYSGPRGSTGVRNAVNQTGSDVQTDRLSLGTTNGPASSGNTPPSSDSGYIVGKNSGKT